MFSNLSRDICGGETVLLFYRDEEDLHHRNVKLRYEISDRALHHAALSGLKHLVCILLQYGHNVNARERINGKTALHYAKSKEIARILLASGAIVDARDRNDETPLHEAIRSKREGVVSILLERGANPNAVMRDQRSPLQIAIENNFAKAIKYLLEHGAGRKLVDKSRTPLHIAAEISDCPETVESLLEHFDIDSQDEDGCTALHLATVKRRIHNVRLLLLRGANVNVKTKGGDMISAMLIPHPQGNFYYVTDPGLIHVVQVCKLHIVKLKTAGLYDAKCNHRALDQSLNQFDKLYRDISSLDALLSNRYQRELYEMRLECNNELETLRACKLTASMSLYDVLLTNKPHYVQNVGLMNALKSINLKRYPHYGGLIRRKVERDEVRSGLLLEARDSFCALLAHNKGQLPTLPLDVEMRVLGYLDDIELENLIQCAKITD